MTANALSQPTITLSSNRIGKVISIYSKEQILYFYFLFKKPAHQRHFIILYFFNVFSVWEVARLGLNYKLEIFTRKGSNISPDGDLNLMRPKYIKKMSIFLASILLTVTRKKDLRKESNMAWLEELISTCFSLGQFDSRKYLICICKSCIEIQRTYPDDSMAHPQHA